MYHLFSFLDLFIHPFIVFLIVADCEPCCGLQVYRSNDKPLYRTGNKVLIAISIWSLLTFIFGKVYYVQRNKYILFCSIIPSLLETLLSCCDRIRSEKWNAMTTEQRDAYLVANKDSGNKRYCL